MSYVFISYSHRDSDVVFPLIKYLDKVGFNTWYDNGIEAGSEWHERIGKALISADAMLVCMSRTADSSQNCRNEINMGLKLKKPMLIVYLEDFALSPGMELQIGTIQSIYKSRFNTYDDLYYEISKSPILAPCSRNAELLRLEEEKRKEEERLRLEKERQARERAEKAKREAEEKERARRAEEARVRAEEEKKARLEREKEAEKRRREEAARIKREAEARARREAEERRKYEEWFNSLSESEKRKHLKEKAREEERKRKEAYRQAHAKEIQKRNSLITASALGCGVVFIILLFALIIPSINDNPGMDFFEQEDYISAMEKFESAGGFSDAESYLALSEGYLLLKEGKTDEAGLAFGKANNEEGYQKSLENYWNEKQFYQTVAMGNDFAIVLNKDGTITYRYVAEGEDRYYFKEYETWENIRSIGATSDTILAVTEDGHVLADGDISIEDKVKKWDNVVAVYGVYECIIALRADGTLLTTRRDGIFEDVREWENVVNLDMVYYYYSENYGYNEYDGYAVVATLLDGSVKMRQSKFYGDVESEVNSWTDVAMVSVARGDYTGLHVKGLKKDGTVLHSGTDNEGVDNVSDWTDIVYIHTTANYAFGVTQSGEIMIAGSDAFSRKDVSNITNASYLPNIDNLLVLTRDGKFQCENGKTTYFSNWDDMVKIPPNYLINE